MLQISPSKSTPLVWHGADPNDTTTLYVRAVVKDASTLAVLNTVNLTDNGSQLFTGSFTSPHDPSQTGTGRFIIIVYTVYTDSAYTIASQNYSRITEQYLVKTLPDANLLGGGGGVIDYRELKKAFSDALKDHKIEFPKPQDFPLDSFAKIVNDAIAKIPSVKIPEPKSIDLSKMEAGLSDVRHAINNLPTPAKQTDLAPVQKEIRSIQSSLVSIVDGMSTVLTKELQKIEATALKENEKMVNTMIQTILTAIQDSIKDGSFRMSVFGDQNPFDTIKQKRTTYLAALASKYTP